MLLRFPFAVEEVIVDMATNDGAVQIYSEDPDEIRELADLADDRHPELFRRSDEILALPDEVFWSGHDDLIPSEK